MFDQIEKLKQQWTDKYVVVDSDRPELRRFEGQTGTVKTVNMSGRALVQFEAYNNIGWYDIALDYLKVIDQPLAKDAKPKEDKHSKAEPKAAPAKKPAAEKPAAKPAEGGKKSVADILAAARAPKAAAGASAAPKPAAPKLAAERPKPAAAASGKMSPAEILAAARAKKPAAEPPAGEPEPAIETAAAATETVSKPTEKADKKPAKAPAGPLPKDFPGIIAWCREHDSK
jgi:hypothetical protein